MTAPIASAGPDQFSVQPWATVTLTGTDTDAENNVNARTWTQLTGTTVTLSGSGATRTFTAPATLTGTTLTFRYTATDAGGLSAIDDVSIAVQPVTTRAVVGGVEVPLRFLAASSVPADTTAPTITSFTATASSGQAALSWSATDNVAVTNYSVTRGGTQVYTGTGTGTSFTDTGLTNGTAYTWTLTARDAAGNTKTATATATPATVTPATVTIGTPTVSDTSVTVPWTTTLGTDGVTPDSVSSSRDGSDSTGDGAFTATGDPINGSRTFNSLVPGQTYHFTVQLVEAGANYGTPATVTVTVPTATIATDSFTGTNGAAPAAQWTVKPGTAQIQNNKLRLTTAASAYSDARVDLTGPAAQGDTDILLTFTFLSSGVEQYFVLGINGDSTSTSAQPGSAYSFWANPFENAISIDRVDGGTDTQLVNSAFTFAASTAYKLRMQRLGTTVRARIWATTGTEPTTWNLSTTIADTLKAGRVSIGFENGSDGVVRSVDIDDMVLSVPAGGTSGGGTTGGSTGGGTTTGMVPHGPTGTWTMQWNDEFEGTSLDTTRWSKMDGSTMNNVTNRASNISVANSCLILTLSDSSNGAEVDSAPYDGAGANGYLVQVGDYIEASVYFPGSGSTIYNWPAFWTSGPNWPAAGEHDIAEGLGPLTVNYHSPSGSHNGPAPSGTWSNAFHTYGMHRKASSADVYWDGVKVHSYSTDDNGGGQAILINVGKSGTVISGTASQVKVDWVRVFRPA